MSAGYNLIKTKQQENSKMSKPSYKQHELDLAADAQVHRGQQEQQEEKGRTGGVGMQVCTWGKER